MSSEFVPTGDPEADARALLQSAGAALEGPGALNDGGPIGAIFDGPTGPIDPTTGEFVGPLAQEPDGIASFYSADFVQTLWRNLPLEDRVRLQDELVSLGLTSSVISGEFDDGTLSGVTRLLSLSNRAGTTWQATIGRLRELEAQGLLGEQEPDFNFVGRDFLPPDPATVDEDIRGLAKKMFAGTDIELSDDEVASLRGQFEGLMREQHFAEEQQRVSDELTTFDANVAASEGRQFNGSVDAVPQVDAGARFRQLFEDRFKSKIDAIDQIDADNESRQLTEQNIRRVMQFATGRS